MFDLPYILALSIYVATNLWSLLKLTQSIIIKYRKVTLFFNKKINLFKPERRF